MKYVFLAALLGLLVASGLGVWTKADAQSSVPVLYWATDPNPARSTQVAAFPDWLRRNGHPACIVRVDAASSDPAKKVIQGVSGVLADLIDLSPTDLPYFVDLGLCADVTEDAKRLGFDPSNTYPAVTPQIVLNGRQYRFPCNVGANGYWINIETFSKAGQPLPPSEWTLETFESVGRAFVASANPPGLPRSVYFVDAIDLNVLRRSMGVDVFNETLTRCTLDDERNVQALERIHQWTFVDHLMPSAAEAESFSSEAGYGKAAPQLFGAGRYAMLWMGRNALIQFRQFGSMPLAVTEPPHQVFRNTSLGTRAAAVYAGSKHKELAVLFLAYLASEEYNDHIIADGDALPPDPAAAKSDAFLRPSAYRNEWNVHGKFAEMAQSIGIVESASPFVLPSIVTRTDRNAYDAFMRSGRLTAEQAAQQAARLINAEITRTLADRPNLRPAYEEAVARQQRIDERRAAGQKVPLDWISNPFHRAYYQSQGWAE